jgi:protein-tyrosine phosphatase
MIDTHCHLVPGVDDGPATEAEAVALAEDLVRDGIHFALCTPHFSRLFPTREAEVRTRYTWLKDTLAVTGIPLGTAIAAEVSAAFVLSVPIEELKDRSVRDRHVVVELHPDTPAGFPALCHERLSEAGLLPVFAHPERCRAIQRDPSLLDSPRAGGGLAQVVAPSLLGRWGVEVTECAWGLLVSGRVDLLGSDAHGVKVRRCHLAEAADLVEKRLGVDARRELTERRPAALVDAALRPWLKSTSARANPDD